MGCFQSKINLTKNDSMLSLPLPLMKKAQSQDFAAMTPSSKIIFY